jgi:hypothetical protein
MRLALLFVPALLLAGDREVEVDKVFQSFTRDASPGCAVGVLDKGEPALGPVRK